MAQNDENSGYELLEEKREFASSYGTAIANRFRDGNNGDDVFVVHTVVDANNRAHACDRRVRARGGEPLDVLAEAMEVVIKEVIQHEEAPADPTQYPTL